MPLFALAIRRILKVKIRIRQMRILTSFVTSLSLIELTARLRVYCCFKIVIGETTALLEVYLSNCWRRF